MMMPSPVMAGMLEVMRLSPRFGHFSPWQYFTRISTLPAKPPVASTTPLLACRVTLWPSFASAITPTTAPLSSVMRLLPAVSMMMVTLSFAERLSSKVLI